MAKIREKQPDADAGRLIVDEQLEVLEARLTAIYGQTAKEVQADLDKFFAKYKKEDAEKQAMVEADELSRSEYIDWRERQIFRTNAMKAKIDDVTARIVNADKQAMSMVNDQLPETYATSYNFGGYRAEAMAHEAGFDYTQFTIINQDAVRTLAKEDPDLIPWKPDPDVEEDKRWNRQHVQNAIFQGITKGDSMPDVAKRLLPVVNMDKNAAIRTARTAVNGIENKGRKDATERVKAAGIPMIETWSCTHDQRTRDTHILLDGTEPDENGMFGKGIISKLLSYPGDPAGDPEEVYNCRCGLSSTIKGIDHSKDDELYAKMMEEEYFEDWVQVKEDREEKEAAFQSKKEGAAERVAARQEKNAAETYSKEPVEIDLPKKSADEDYAGHKETDTDYLMHRKDSFGVSNAGAEALADDLGVSKKDAKRLGNAVVNFTSDDYSAIREASRGDSDNAEMIKTAEDIEKFIELSPKWDGGEISRGIFVEGDLAKEIKANAEEGLPIDMLGVSSWSSDSEVAWKVGGGYIAEMDDQFKTEEQKEGRSIIFVNDQEFTNLGTSVEHLSYHNAESEVIVSGDAVFMPTNVDEQKDAIYIHGYLADKNDIDQPEELPKASELLPAEDLTSGKNGRVQGKDLSNSWKRREDEFEFGIDDIIDAQGFNGLPKVLNSNDFEKAVKESNFIAQRTYSAPDQETLNSYRDQLYNGDWYVDCSTGGCDYGQGMYGASLSGTEITKEIKEEMEYYQSISESRINYGDVKAVHMVETFTLTPDAKTIDFNQAREEKDEYLWRKYALSHPESQEGDDDRVLELSARYVRESSNLDSLDFEGKAKLKERLQEEDERLWRIYEHTYSEALWDETDVGTYAAMKGYDAIISKSMGAGDVDYVVVLNRTKCIFKRDDS